MGICNGAPIHKPKLVCNPKESSDFQMLHAQFTFDSEGLEKAGALNPWLNNSRIPSVPSYCSGLTIGRGYDLKERSTNAIYKTLRAIGVDESTAEAYRDAAGKYGIGNQEIMINNELKKSCNKNNPIEPDKSACQYYKDNFEKLKPLTPYQQKKLFEICYPYYICEVVRISCQPKTINDIGILDWDRLHSRVKELLVDLRFQGCYNGTTRKDVQKTVTNLDLNPEEKLNDFKAQFSGTTANIEYWKKFQVNKTRTLARRDFIQPIDRLLVEPLGPSPSRFTYQWEESNLTPKLDADSKNGIVIGKGFILGNTRYFGSGGSQAIAIRKTAVEKYLKYVGVTNTEQINALKNALDRKGNEAQQYLMAHISQLGEITEEIEKKLFNLIYPRFESKVIEVCSRDDIIAKFGPVNWFRLKGKIKTILIDLAFTGHYNNSEVLDKLQPYVVNNQVEGFTQALETWHQWDTFQDFKVIFKERFDKRIEHLKSLIEYPPEPEDKEAIYTEADYCPIISPVPTFQFPSSSTALPVLEPALIATPRYQFIEVEGKKVLSGTASELIKSSNLIPNMIQVIFQPHEGKRKMTDISFPVLDEPAIFKRADTDLPNVITLPEPQDGFGDIREGMRFRYEKRPVDGGQFPSYGYAYITAIKEGKLELSENINFEELANYQFQIDSTFFLPLNKFNLSGLLGNQLPSIDIMISSPMGKMDVQQFMGNSEENAYNLPIVVDVFIPKLKGTEKEYQHLSLLMQLSLEKNRGLWRLKDTMLYLSLPETPEDQILEFGVFSILLPKRPPIKSMPSFDSYDVSLDLKKRELVFAANGASSPKLYFPGGLKDEIKGKTSEEIEKAKSKRFVCEFIPQKLADNNDSQYFFKFGNSGVSFEAKVSKTGVSLGDDQSLLLEPRDSGGTVKSNILIRNNNIEAASIGASVKLPGFKDLCADVEVSIRKDQPEAAPVIVAGISLKNSDALPLAGFSFTDMLHMQLTRLQLELGWILGTSQWDFKAIVDGNISFAPTSSVAEDLEGLKKLAAITVENLDLLKLNQPDVNLDLHLKNDVNFSVFNHLFDFSLSNLSLHLGTDNTAYLASKRASIAFNQPGTLEVAIDTKSYDNQDVLWIDIKKLNADLSLKKPLGITVKLGPSITFRGEFGRVSTPDQRFFFASGYAELEGLPRFDCLLKFGVVKKQSGEVAPNVVLYGEAGLDIELYPGVVVKSLGCGIGINNRLIGIDATPNENEILENIDKIVPSQLEGWSPVNEDGFYLSIVGSTILASNLGSPQEINAYVAELILSLDTELNAVAAGRIWFSSSVNFARNHRSNPAMVGAIALSPRQKRLGARLESRPQPQIERNPWLEKILDATSVRISFQLTPQVVDYYLEEVKFQHDFLGIQMQYVSSYRFAVFRRAVLLKSTQAISGYYHNSLRAGPGGIDFYGDVHLIVYYAGLLSSQGLVAYGGIDARLSFRADAFIEIGFEKTIRVWKWKKTISWTKKFSVTLQTDIRFSGQVAIVENGRFGFDGTVSVSVSICGYPLSIRAPLSYNNDIVHQAIQQITIFEKQLNISTQSTFAIAFAREAFSLEFKQRSLTDINENWLHYYNAATGYHLLIPAEHSVWYTPQFNDKQQLINAVERIEVLNEQGQLLVAIDTLWKSLSESSSEPIEELQQPISYFLETTQTKDDRELDGQQPIVLVDPRVDADLRDYLSHKDQMLPSYALSYEFRDVSELLSDSTATASCEEIQEIIDYETAKKHAATFKYYSLDNEDEYEKSRQNRARVTKILLDDLNHPEKPQLFGPYPNYGVGLIFKIEGDKTTGFLNAINGNHQNIRISRRQGAELELISGRCKSMTERGKTTDYKTLIKALPIRQKYIEKDSSSNANEYSKIVVKLPLNVEELIKAERLAEVSHFQVYRLLPGQEQPELIADYARLEISYLNLPEVQVTVNATVEGQVAKFIINEESIQEKIRKLNGEACILLLEDIYVHVERLAMEANGAVTCFLEQRSLHRLTNLGANPRCTLLINNTKKMIIDPFLFTDEYYIKNNRVYIKREKNGKQWYDDTSILLDRSEIQYSLKIMPFEDLPGSDEENRSIPFTNSLKLHLPRQVSFSKAVSIVFPVSSLILDAPQSGQFQFINTETRQVESSQGVELWVKQIPLRKSGFYGGEQDNFLSQSTTSPDLSKVSLGPLYESTTGKIKIEFFSEIQGICTITNLNSYFTEGYGYQFFVRPKLNNDSALLQPLPHLLVKKLPDYWSKNEKVKFVEQIEWIKSLQNLTTLENSDFYINKIFDVQDRQNYVDINFISAETLTGGVEIFIRDRDEPSIYTRQTCELLEEDLFVQDQRNFNQPALWEIAPSQIIPPLTPIGENTEIISDSDIFPFYFDVEHSSSDVIKFIKNKVEELKKIEEREYDWRSDLYPVLVGYLSAIRVFEKSPLNVNAKEVNEAISLARCIAVNLLIGTSKIIPNEPTPLIEPIPLVDIYQSLDLLEKEAVQYSEIVEKNRQSSEEDKNIARYTDLLLSRELLGILRCRIGCAVSLLALSSVEHIPYLTRFNHSEREILPHYNRWNEIKQKYLSSNEFPLVQKIISTFDLTIPSAKSLLVDLKNRNLLKAIADKDASIALAKVVPQGRVLAEILDKLEALFLIEKRPHHGLCSELVQKGVEEGQRQPKPVDLKLFFPGLESKIESGSAFDSSKNIVCFFNLMEYLGFSIDFSLVNSNSTKMSQKEIYEKTLDATQARDDRNQYVVIILRPASPIRSKSSEESLGFSFVHLALIPKKLYSILASPNLNNNQIQSLKTWLGFRGIKCGDKDDDNRYLTHLNKMARYIHQYVADVNAATSLYLQPWDKRWMTLPSIACRVETSYRVPDVCGHRYEVAIRKISRYEPLINWERGIKKSALFSPKDLEQANAVWKQVEVYPVQASDSAAYSNMLQVYNMPHPEVAQFIYQLPSHAARSMKNQVAAIRTGFQGSDLVFRYEPIDQAEAKSLQKIIDHISFATQESAKVDFVPENLTYDPQVTPVLFDNERFVQIPKLPYYYKYYLSPRVLYRSEIEPKELFHSLTINGERTIDQLTMEKPSTLPPIPWWIEVIGYPGLWRATQVSDTGNTITITLDETLILKPGVHVLNFYEDLSLKHKQTPAMLEPKQIGLFQPGLQQIIAPTSTLEDDPDNSPTDTPEDEDPSSEPNEDEADSHPSIPYIPDPIDLDIVIYLSRHIDYYTDSEAPPHLEVSSTSTGRKIFIHELPDLATDYRLYWRTSNGEYYIPVLTIRMPWSEENRTESYPVITDLAPNLEISSGGSPNLQIESLPIGEGLSRYMHRIKFRLKILPDSISSNLFFDPEKFYLQGERKSRKTQAIKFKKVSL